MRITKPVERWFDVPDDQDGAKVKIKHLTPGEIADIYDQAFKQNVSYTKDKDGKYVPKFSQENNKKMDREMTLKKSVVDWENFFDHDDKPMECTPENIIRASEEIEGFSVLITELRGLLEKDIVKEREEQRKNLKGSASGRKKIDCPSCRTVYSKLYDEEPPCDKCIEPLEPENIPVYEVYRMVFGNIENVDVFKAMELIGIEDKKYCFDLVQFARYKVNMNNKDKT